jgi:hypothetical protein
MGLSGGDRLAIVAWIAVNPEAGDVIEGTGCARKVLTGLIGNRNE